MTPPARVLVLAFHFPPDPAVGGLRAAKVARALRDGGYAVDVIASCLKGSDPEVSNWEDNILVHRVAATVTAREAYLGMKARVRGKGAAGQESERKEVSAAAYSIPAGIPRWKRYLFSLLWLPDDQQGWIVPAVRCGLSLMPRGFDVIYTTAPPFSAFLAGLRLKRRTGIPWCVEFRDPWVERQKPALVRSQASDRVEAWLERRCLRAADMIVAVTESFGEILRSKERGRSRGRVVVALNGIDELEAVPGSNAGTGPRVVYVGTLYQKRDPRPFLRAVARLRLLGKLPAGTQIDFIGDCRWFQGASIPQFVEELGIQDVTRFRDWVTPGEAASAMSEADVLLLLAQEQPLQVPTKLYEYLGTRKRILAFCEGGGESAEMLSRVKRHVVVTSSREEEVNALVEDALIGRPRPVEPDEAAVLEGWTSKRQMEKVVRGIQSLKPGRRT